MNRSDSWFADTPRIDPNNTIYQNNRSVTNMTLDIGSLAIGGYGIAKTGFKAAEIYALSRQTEILTGKLALNEVKFAISSGAENVNAAISLTTKLRQLENMQQTSAKVSILPDGRIRYYKAERRAAYPGVTRGAAYVTEYNPAIGQVRGWNECYDQLGNVNRVHPKDINGQSIVSPHYPLIAREIMP